MQTETQRMLWRCRRGLLELDLVLGAFVRQRYSNLTAAQQETFGQLLDHADNDLWDLITGRKAAEDLAQRAILQTLGKSGADQARHDAISSK